MSKMWTRYLPVCSHRYLILHPSSPLETGTSPSSGSAEDPTAPRGHHLPPDSTQPLNATSCCWQMMWHWNTSISGCTSRFTQQKDDLCPQSTSLFVLCCPYTQQRYFPFLSWRALCLSHPSRVANTSNQPLKRSQHTCPLSTKRKNTHTSGKKFPRSFTSCKVKAFIKRLFFF